MKPARLAAQRPAVPECAPHGGDPTQTQRGRGRGIRDDLDAAVAYARERGDGPAESAALYGGVPGGLNVEAEELIRTVMAQHDGRAAGNARSSVTQYCLAVDLGSGALKVGAVTLTGEVTAVSEAEIETERPGPGAAVQDSAGWWDLVREHSKKVLSGIPAEQVVAVSCTGQWASTVPVDAEGIPVGPCVTWLDTRGARYSREVVGGP